MPAPTTPSSHETLADAIRGWIALGTYAPGERLPSERQLAEQFAVGRVTVRRAIGLLAGEGLVATARGRSGGSTVLPPSAGSREVAVEELLVVVRDSFEFRLAVEPACAALAAERGTPEDGQALLELVEGSAASFGEYRALDSRFHVAIARATGNELLVDAVSSSRTHFFGWADVIRRHTDWAELDAAERDFGAHHRAVAEAVAGRRADAARELMVEHLLAGEAQYQALVRGFGPPGR